MARKQLGASTSNASDATNKAYVDSGLAVKATSLVATAVKTTTYAAAVSDLIPADATSGGFTITLPTAPADTSRILIKKIDSSANAVTIATGGSDVFNTTGGSTSMTLTLQHQAMQLQYVHSSAIWYVTSTDAPLAQIYAATATLTNKTIVNGTSGNSISGIGIAALSATGTASSTTYLRGDNIWSTITYPTAGLPYDVIGFAQTLATRATGAGDNTLGAKMARNCTFTSVTFRCITADASGNLVVELRKNGTTVSGTSTTIAAANQVAGGTTTGSWSFSLGDILTVYITAVGTTPGRGLVADITGVTA